MKLRVLLSVSFLLVALLGGGCEMPKLPATGNEDEIIVFADDTSWNTLAGALRGTFEDTVMTPQPERWFTLVREPFSAYASFETHKNRLLVGTLDGDGPVSEFLQQSLDTSVRTMVETGKEFVFNKYDAQSRGQILMVLAGQDLSLLRSSIQNRSQDLLYFFKKMLITRELAALEAESKYHKVEITRHLMRDYGWSMTIQHDYRVARDTAGDRFFWMRRANPTDMERWIFAAWVDSVDPRNLTEQWVIGTRNRMTEKYLRTVEDDAYVEIAPYNLESSTVSFLGRFAYETRGNWRFSDKSGGGPFVNYTLYDEKTRRIYMLDGSIFAPRVEKKKLILQVDGILHTFKTYEDLTADEQEEIRQEQEEARR